LSLKTGNGKLKKLFKKGKIRFKQLEEFVNQLPEKKKKKANSQL